MKKELKYLILGLLIISSFSLFTGCATVHRYSYYQGKVIDAETKEPLEGAAVLAVYYTVRYTVSGSKSSYVDAQEAVTDKNGEFKIPSKFSFTFRPLQHFSPRAYFTIFKPGYGYYPGHRGSGPLFDPNRTLPPKEYVTIWLPKLKTREERRDNYCCSPVSVPDEKMMKLLHLIDEEAINLGLEPIYRGNER